MLFRNKDKPAAITIETGQELKHMFDSRVITVDLNKSVTEIIVLLLANHEIGAINESEYGLYAKESSHTLHRLESNRTLRENRVRNKVGQQNIAWKVTYSIIGCTCVKKGGSGPRDTHFS